MDPSLFLQPDWSAPARVRALCTLRAADLARLGAAAALPGDPQWLVQVHGSAVADLDRSGSREADAAFTRQPGRVCAIRTADCLPVLLCAADGSAVAAAHAGWRGLAAGVLESTVSALAEAAPDVPLLAWLGPAIGPAHFEVGEEVRQAFVDPDPDAEIAFVENARGRWQCDLYTLARRALALAGVAEISGGGHCTFAETERFFSYRRDGGRTGRMASLIWLDPGP